MSNLNDFVIENGILIKYTGEGGDVVIPSGITSISNMAFAWCKTLTSVEIPDGVTSIGVKAFYNCVELAKIHIPDSICDIGNSAFAGCKKLADNEGFVVVKNILYNYYGETKNVSIKNNVTKIESTTFKGCENLESITLPRSVIEIGDNTFVGCFGATITCYGETPVIESGSFGYGLHECVKLSFPDVDLTQKNKIPAFMAYGVEIKNAEEYACVLLFQSGKKWEGLLDCADVDANEVVGKFKQLLSVVEKFGSAQWKKILEYIKITENNLNKDVLVSFMAQVEQKDKKAYALLNDSAEVKRIISANVEREMNPVEKLVRDIMKPSSELKIALKELTDVVHYDNSEEVCDPVVFAYIVSEYMKLHNLESIRNVSEYKTACTFLPEVDKIADSLDKSEFLNALKTLAFEKGDSFILPYAHFADETHTALLVAQMNKWGQWNKYAATGRKNISIARCGLLLNETKTAMLRLDADGQLDEYAQLRGLDVEVLRNSQLLDFGFDANRQIRYDLGDNAVIATLDKDLTLILTDENSGKIVKSVPKKNADATLYENVKTEISALKKNIKKAVTNCKKSLFEKFLSGEVKDSTSWQEIYLNNQVMNSVAKLVIWNQEGNNFVLTDSGTIRFDGKPYAITNAPIGVSHPIEMTNEIAAWQNYFASRGIKQLFEQIWEPVYKQEDIKTDRYLGCSVTAYKMVDKEAHGIFNYGMYHYSSNYGFELTDCEIKFKKQDERFFQGKENKLVLGELTIKEFTRYTNHIIYMFDVWTITDKILTDDMSVENILHRFTVKQIMEFIEVATEHNCVNVTGLLLNYKNKNFADFDVMDELTLDL